MLVRPLTRPLVRPLTRRVTEPGFGWSPRALFANGEQGAWYDPSDLSTLYQDSAGTTPVTALGQPVGLMLDKSGRGNHASQPTSTSRPTLQARVNLLTQTEDFAHAAWEKLSAGSATAPVLTAGFGAAPDGSLTAARLQAARTGNSTADYSLLQQTGAASTLLHCGSVWAKSNTGVDQTIYFRIAHVPSTALVTTEWQRIQVQGTPVSASYLTLGVRGGSGQTDVDILIWHPQLELGDTPTTYQRVTSATDYADVGAKRYLQFDGVDDFLVTSAIDFTGTDKMTVVAGVRKESDVATGTVCELSVHAGLNGGAFYIEAPSGGGNSNIVFLARGTANRLATATPIAAPTTRIVVGQADIAAPSVTIRVDGALMDMNAEANGAVMFGAHQLYIGSRGGTTQRMKGRIYSLLVRGALSTPAQIAAAERYAAAKTGVTLA